MAKKVLVNADLEPDRKPFHITIGTASKEGMSLETDLRMLRSGLIYGDKVKLCSYTTPTVLSLFIVWNNSLKEFLEWGEENIIWCTPDNERREKN